MNYFIAVTAFGVAAIAIWSGFNGANGFTEVRKMLAGQPSFNPPLQPDDSGISLPFNIPFL